MLIDFHTHAFADSIAERAINKLMKTAAIPCHTDGTAGGLRNKLNERGIDYGVLLPVATKPSQQETVNNWAASENCGNLVAFGSIHPQSPKIADSVSEIRDRGLKGIKLHPAYQGVYLFDNIMTPIFKYAEMFELPVIIHMGYDPLCPRERHAMPYHLKEISENFPNLVIIAAHLGGMFAWEEVLRYVCGLHNIYLDTAFIGGNIETELLRKIIAKHGADKILFGSDLPWHDPIEELEMIHTLRLSDSDERRILCENAVRILDL